MTARTFHWLVLVLGVVSVSPADSYGIALQYSVDGNACLINPADASNWWTLEGSGLKMDGQNDVCEMVCPIRVGPATLPLTELSSVMVYMYIGGAADEHATVQMYAHDWGSEDRCECDDDVTYSRGYWAPLSGYSGDDGYCDDASCPGGDPAETDWLVNLTVELANHFSGANYVTVKTLAVFSAD